MRKLRSAACALSVVLASSFAVGCQTVKPAAGANSVDDGSISARVKTVLLNDTQVNATKINVSTTNGVVVMSGSVPSKDQEQRAIQLARQVNGVRDVRSELQVGTPPTTPQL